MRKPKYISPTQLKLFFKDRREYYLSYLADNPPPRMPQTGPMSIGSAFDAFCKSYLNQMIYGKVDPAFEVTAIFETQVEPQNRDYAWKHGAALFEKYKTMGALANLMIELDTASEPPQFEFTIQDNIKHESCINGIELLGKPDVYFRTKENIRVIYDWKVNGYFGTRMTSPKPGYLKLLPDHKMHKNCVPTPFGGLMINGHQALEDIDRDWADQLITYAWLLGEKCGNQFIIGIEQITSNGRTNTDTVPEIRVASHRYLSTFDYQAGLLERYAKMQSILDSGNIFECPENDAICEELDNYHLAYSDANDNEKWYTNLMRSY